MGYTGAMFLTSIVLAVPILSSSALLFWILRWLRAVPSGGASVLAYLLLVCAGYATLFLYASADMLLLAPIQLQQRYLGRIEASPLSLRSYSHEGFMDPGDSWSYALRPDVTARLQRHCLPLPTAWEKTEGRIRCYIVSREDERTYSDIWIEQGRLHLEDGLH